MIVSLRNSPSPSRNTSSALTAIDFVFGDVLYGNTNSLFAKNEGRMIARLDIRVLICTQVAICIVDVFRCAHTFPQTVPVGVRATYYRNQKEAKI